MFPRISDLINYLFGSHLDIPVQSYGFMMAVAFLSGGWVLYHELKRLEKAKLIHAIPKKTLQGAPATIQELIFSGLLGFILGWKVIGIALNYQEFVRHPQEFIISGEGSFIAGILMAVLFVVLPYYQKKRKQLTEPVLVETLIHPYQLTGNIALIAGVSGIIGSKIFDTMEHLPELIKDPIETIFSFSGLSFYGGLIVAAFAVVYYANKNKIRFPFITDVTAPALILAYPIGRIGCQLSGDGCWGIPNLATKPSWLGFLPDWMWAFQFPHNVIDEGVPLAGCIGNHCFVLLHPVYPTSFYETLLGLIIFGVLWLLRKHLTIPGYLFSIYLILNGTERFFIEQIRVNPVYHFLNLNLTQAGIIAVVLIILGFTGFWFFKWLDKRNPRNSVNAVANRKIKNES